MVFHENSIYRLFFFEKDTIWNVTIILAKFCTGVLKSKSTFIKISMKGGFGSPDITAMVYGAIFAVRPVFRRRIKIACFPEMMAPLLSGHIKINAVFKVYRILAETLLLVFRLPKLKLAKIALNIHKGHYDASSA
jgi:hypothetical protein